MFRTRFIAIAALLISAAVTTVHADGVDPERLRAHTEYLSSDALEGRAPGSHGEELTMEYLEKEFTSYGFGPGAPGGTFRQQVPLVAITATNAPALVLSDDGGEEQFRYRYGPEFMCWTLQQRPAAEVHNAELVFVGYGVVAPEYDWNDYKDADVAGKVIVMLVNDPPLDDETMFGGKAMTYYGRWTYKYEIAAKMGAAGAIIIHNTEAAGYGWAVVENSWTGEQFTIARDNANADRCALESWVTEDVAREIFSAAGRSLESAYEEAKSPDFRPYNLGLHASVRIENDLRTLDSNNFLARLDGNDPELDTECIVYNAHWDHLGVGKAVDGDSIYNGALDNASGVAGMLEIARLFGEHSGELSRSVIFLIPTAEESGLLGAYYYVDHPTIPLNRTVAMINADGLNVWGKTKDMVVVGYGQSDLDAILEGVLAAGGRRVSPDTEPEKGFYYRSDHFAFAKKGVPALYADGGVEVIGRPEGWGMERRRQYNRKFYHTPDDEYDPDWDFTGAAEDMMALFRVGLKLATSDRWPHWSETSEFRSVREQSLQGGK
jgi:Zn-dependent M28 family amino/carboxypeptidase